MMNNKITMYAFLALILGYSLITYVPSAFTPTSLQSQRDQEIDDKVFSSIPDGETLDSEGKLAGDSSSSPEDSTNMQLESNMQYVYLVIDLSIALAVYYIFRKRIV